jgi:cyclohexa-1,5-dienecarbonyl-CoA hydratase
MPIDLSFNTTATRASLVFRESPGNVITAALVAQMRAVLDDLQYSQHLRLFTIEGAGPDFSFGASIPEHTPEEIARVLPEMHALVRDLVSVPVATAAVVRGRCLGGGFELALACDFILSADDATFGLPEIALGVFPPAGSVLLPVRAGAGRATATILTGLATPALEWHRAGVVSLLAPAAALPKAVDAWFASSLALYSAEALRHAVRVVRMPVAAAVDRNLAEAERLYLKDLMVTADAREGVRAFLEKRRPTWRDE